MQILLRIVGEIIVLLRTAGAAHVVDGQVEDWLSSVPAPDRRRGVHPARDAR